MAAALGVVNVGKTEWLLLKLTPLSEPPEVMMSFIVGASVGLTEPARRPSATKMSTLRLRSSRVSRASQAGRHVVRARGVLDFFLSRVVFRRAMGALSPRGFSLGNLAWMGHLTTQLEL